MRLHLENEVAVVKTTTIISNNPVFKGAEGSYISSILQDHNIRLLIEEEEYGSNQKKISLNP